ncbi:HD-GYP domain-containing protein [Halalkalibacter urbisdiaboli]|uniref:HD-GYP domain-containing protein n=1 Tax=Halalkalibacter urbisdiaboli TaxID=1960589 RepID=UPI000B4348AE|nr:HD domain-containing phosphohydrolase [Halalkalibacter urbisdiaboli]
MARCFYDIGKVKVVEDVLTKPGALTEEEYRQIQMHTVYGYQLLKEEGSFSEDICLMALEHHEREDGTGYPYKKTADQMNRYSKIIAVADVFHAMTSDRVYQVLPFMMFLKK